MLVRCPTAGHYGAVNGPFLIALRNDLSRSCSTSLPTMAVVRGSIEHDITAVTKKCAKRRLGADHHHCCLMHQ